MLAREVVVHSFEYGAMIGAMKDGKNISERVVTAVLCISCGESDLSKRVEAATDALDKLKVHEFPQETQALFEEITTAKNLSDKERAKKILQLFMLTALTFERARYLIGLPHPEDIELDLPDSNALVQ